MWLPGETRVMRVQSKILKEALDLPDGAQFWP